MGAAAELHGEIAHFHDPHHVAVLLGLDANALRKMGDFLRDKEPGVVGVMASVNDGKITFQAVCGKEAVARGVKAGCGG